MDTTTILIIIIVVLIIGGGGWSREVGSTEERSLKLANLYAQVTNQIVAELESGAVPWTKPWRNTAPVGSVMPHNAATNRPYSGINIPILWGAALTSGYDRHLWMTYKQALAAGAQVRGGEHGTIVVFTKKLKVGDNEEERLVSMLRTYTVFNVAQIDGLPTKEPVILTGWSG